MYRFAFFARPSPYDSARYSSIFKYIKNEQFDTVGSIGQHFCQRQFDGGRFYTLSEFVVRWRVFVYCIIVRQ